MKKRLLIISITILALAGLFGASGQAAHAATLFQPPNNNGLLAWWPLDEGNGTVAHDLSGNGYTGTINNFTTTSGVTSPTWAAGQFGNALSFGSTGQYAVASTSSAAAFDYSKSWTFSLWINQSPAATSFPISLVTNTNSPAFLSVIRIVNTGLFQTIINQNKIYTASTTLSFGVWHNLIVAWDSSANTLSFYVDGASVGSTPVTPIPVATPVREFVLGSRGNTFNISLLGSLDDVRIYQRALSASEAANIYSGASVSSANLIAWWKLDESGGYSAADSSGYGQTAYLSQEGWVAGRKGKALAFLGGEDAARAVTTSLTNATGDGTIAAWFRSPGLHNDAGRTEHIIVGAGAPTDGVSTNVAWIYLKSPWAETTTGAGTGPAGALSFLWNCPNCSSGTNRLDTAKSYDDNQWHFAVMTQSGGTMTAYVDGALVGTAPGATSIDATYPYYIGSVKTDAAGWNFDGAIDDVRVYSRALSATEVKTLYTAGQATKKVISNNGLVGWWTFDEGTSTIAHDFSGNGNSGTLTNGPVWTNGKKGGALSFNGTTANVRAPSFHTGSTQTKTVSFWFKPASISQTGDLVTMSADTNDYKWQYISQCNQSLSFMFGDNSFYNERGNCSIGNVFTRANVWYHVAVVVDITQSAGNRVKVYVNGTAYTPSFDNDSGNAFYDGTDLKLYVGGANLGSGGITSATNSTIDDVRVYSRALSAAEVSKLYTESATRIGHSQETSASSGLVAYWSFNGPDMDWNVLRAWDRSGHGNDGTLTNLSQSGSVTGGRVGQAFYAYNGGAGGYIANYSPTSLPTGTAARSVSVWYKADSLPAGRGSSRQAIAGYGDPADGSNQFLIMIDTASCNPTPVLNLNGASGHTYTLPAGTDMLKWHHIVAVLPAGATNLNQATMYLDGVQLADACLNTSVTLNTIATELVVGDLLNSTPGHSQTLVTAGKIDEFRVYNRDLSASEIKQLYRLGK